METGLWTAYEAAAATGGALCARGPLADGQSELPEENWAANGLSIDTRTIKPGDIFVALKDARDGHDFVPQAFEAGAAAALVSRAPEDTPEGAPLLLVQDTLNGLEQLAAAARDRCFGKLIGVTGSAGKTSTKEQLRAALSPSGKVHAAQKSFNNHLGVPLTLAALPSDADYGVFEIGMNHAGEITPLTKLVKPHVAIITTVAAAHLEFFDSVEGIAEAKAEILLGVRSGGTVILPKDNKYFDLLANRATQVQQTNGPITILTFGSSAGADIRMLDYSAGANGQNRVKAELFGKPLEFTMAMAGEHQAMNALAVLGAVHATGASVDAAVEALGQLGAVGGRGEPQALTLDGKRITLIDESYNANPVSMAAAIKVLAGWQGEGRKIAVLGDMLELGPDGPRLHMEIAPQLVDAGIDHVYAAGELMKPMLEKLPEGMQAGWQKSASDLFQVLKEDLRDGDVLMAKGSNASRVTELVRQIKGQAGA
jgi:UDP-N-acetylmuramoyl-tripeptide--D-alanyl-D-alanine ligase